MSSTQPTRRRAASASAVSLYEGGLGTSGRVSVLGVELLQQVDVVDLPGPVTGLVEAANRPADR